MRHLTHRHPLAIMLGFAVALGLASAASADEPPDHYGRVSVENIWVTPAKVGGYSALHFRLVNESRDPAYLLEVKTPVAATARIVGRVGEHETTTIGSIGLRPDSNIDVGSDHTWVEIGPLKRAVTAGETIPLELVFMRHRVHVDAHVHSADG